MEKKKCTQKFMYILTTKEFCKLQKDSTKTIEMKIQRAVRKTKNKLFTREYLKSFMVLLKNIILHQLELLTIFQYTQ